MAGLDVWKISSPPGFDPGPSSPLSVAISTELPPPPHTHTHTHTHIYIYIYTVYNNVLKALRSPIPIKVCPFFLWPD